MNLAFSTHWKNTMPEHLAETSTNFPEKVIRSLDLPEYKLMTQFDLLNEVLKEKDILPITAFQSLTPKPHTMREDKKNRWKVGNKIHFYINQRTVNQYQFAPVLIVRSIQRVNIFRVAPVSTPYTIKSSGITRQVEIDGRCLTKEEIKLLAINDGFNNVDDFFAWFKDDWSGKLIHWTDLKY